MTDNIRNASDQALRYICPQVKVIGVKVQNMFCQSPTLNGWNIGSTSEDIDMGE